METVVGARAATADLELEDYDALFARRTIYTGTRTSDPAAATQPLYQRILGDAWDALPAPLRAMHHCTSPQVAAGQAEVLRGRHPLARLVAFAMGFPAAGQQVPLQVEFTPGVGGERWTRTFAGRSFTSFQSAGRGTSAHLLRERFGPLTFDLAPVVEGAKLCLVVRRWSLWGLPLPLLKRVRACCPLWRPFGYSGGPKCPYSTLFLRFLSVKYRIFCPTL